MYPRVEGNYSSASASGDPIRYYLPHVRLKQSQRMPVEMCPVLGILTGIHGDYAHTRVGICTDSL